MMYVADTHAVLWFLTEDSHLSAIAKEKFESAERGETVILIASISLLELLYVCKKKKMLPLFTEFLKRLEKGNNYVIYELDFEIVKQCLHLNEVDEMHDRVLVATTQLVGAPLITIDQNIWNSHYVETVW